MRYKLLWMPQTEAFIKALAPKPRQAMRQALKKLAAGKTAGLDLRTLEGSLKGYMRLRVQTYRVIYTVTTADQGPSVILVAAGPRSTVYEAFEKILAEQTWPGS